MYLERNRYQILESADFNALCQKAQDKWGREKQLIKSTEELSELQKEICKVALGDSSPLRLRKLSDEMADTYMMMHQLYQMCDLKTEVEKAMLRKIRRLKKRLAS
jgi:hypothetical protein